MSRFLANVMSPPLWKVTYFHNGNKTTVEVNAPNRRFAFWNAREASGIWDYDRITIGRVKENKETEKR